MPTSMKCKTDFYSCFASFLDQLDECCCKWLVVYCWSRDKCLAVFKITCQLTCVCFIDVQLWWDELIHESFIPLYFSLYMDDISLAPLLWWPVHTKYVKFSLIMKTINGAFADAYIYFFSLHQGIWTCWMDQSDTDAFHDQHKDSLHQCQTMFVGSYIR